MVVKNKELARRHSREHYERNKSAVLARVARRRKVVRKELSKWVTAYKADRGCSNCPERDPVCLDFHHQTGDKELEIGFAVRGQWSMERLMEEINKCVILCANCHRKLHAKERSVGMSKMNGVAQNCQIDLPF